MRASLEGELPGRDLRRRIGDDEYELRWNYGQMPKRRIPGVEAHEKRQAAMVGDPDRCIEIARRYVIPEFSR